jgi:hypothetical protein
VATYHKTLKSHAALAKICPELDFRVANEDSTDSRAIILTVHCRNSPQPMFSRGVIRSLDERHPFYYYDLR